MLHVALLAAMSMASVTSIKLAAWIAQWIVAAMLVALFLFVVPVTTHRRGMWFWTAAWFAQLVQSSLQAPYALAMLNHGAIPSLAFGNLAIFEWPARALFLGCVAFGAMDAAGVRTSASRVTKILLGVLFVGVIFNADSINSVATRFDLVANVVVCFGCALLLLSKATGARRRGRAALGGAMALYGAVTTIHLLTNLESTAAAYTRLVRIAIDYSVYADTAVLVLLAAAVVVLIVQDSFVTAEEAHASRVTEVAASERRLIGIIEAAQEAIVTVGTDGRIELVNGAAAALFGVTPSSVVGRPLSAMLPEAASHIPPFTSDVARAGGAASGATHDAHGIRTDGTAFPAEFTVGSLPATGRGGSVVVVRDLTHQHAAAAERDAFERRVAEAEKMMAIGRVVSGVAHELNNPLAVVLGQSEQLTEAASNPEIRSGLQMIHEQAHRARHIIKDLLAFVRQREEPRERIDLRFLVESTVAIHRAEAAARGVTLVTDLPPAFPLVSVDQVAIEQVLINLLDNASDAVEGDGVVRVAASAYPDRVEIAVEDSGTGLPDEMVSRVFEPFFTTKRLGQGTGLGLAVSLGIAQQHGGGLRFENRPAEGIGARVVLTLPVVAGLDAEPPREQAPRTFPPPPRGNGSAPEVMVIDDEAAVRATLGRMFRRAGWEVREAESGETALGWLESVESEGAPAVILCDLKMPGIGGREVYEHLAQSRPDLAERLVFVTGDIVESVSSGFVAASGREVVEKPFTVAEIAGAVERVVNHSS